MTPRSPSVAAAVASNIREKELKLSKIKTVGNRKAPGVEGKRHSELWRGK
jgi:hypothetical protein